MSSPKPDPARSFESIARCTLRATDARAAALQHFIGTAFVFGVVYVVASPAGPPLMLDPRLRPGAWAANAGDPWIL